MSGKDTRAELEALLRGIKDDDEFVCGVISFSAPPENWPYVIRYIKRGEHITPADLLTLSLIMHYEPEEAKKYC